LGDVFAAWVGDDDDDPFADEVKNRLRLLGETGGAVYFMHGNRDFLIGDRFASESGCRLLDGPAPG
jgi:UDP-2,3-diacylglucosamine hydrolase